MRIDLNADVGESFGAYTLGDDEAVMRSVTSANVAAGFHAGDPTVLRRTIRLARELGVAVGAHPSFPDLAGFGRREMALPSAETEDLVLYQVAAVAGIAKSEGVALAHVKPHGALYNMAAHNRELAESIARAVFSFDPGLVLFALPQSALAAAGKAIGLRVALEGFADRAYQPDGALVPRNRPGAVIASVEEVVTRALQMAVERTVIAIDGSVVRVDADTLCIHGDTPGAATMAAWIRAGLGSADVDLRAPRD
ncbi:MAG TPA: 5-oxoprolinase subunit PxpA [Vicinamibacterales bacterium]|nr:5-oxoprolinase subunit PxpA [Vicinamibacterales bacterium]